MQKMHQSSKCGNHRALTDGQTLAMCASGCWRTVAGHEWHSECGDSVSDIIKGQIIGVQAQCVLHISMCHVLSASTINNRPLVFQLPTWGVYQSKCDTLSPVCFLLCPVPLLIWAVTFYWKDQLAFSCWSCYGSWLKLVRWRFIDGTAKQPACSLWRSWLTLLDKVTIYHKNFFWWNQTCKTYTRVFILLFSYLKMDCDHGCWALKILKLL